MLNQKLMIDMGARGNELSSYKNSGQYLENKKVINFSWHCLEKFETKNRLLSHLAISIATIESVLEVFNF